MKCRLHAVGRASHPAQDAAGSSPSVIQARIPEQGRLLTFSRGVAVDTGADLHIAWRLKRSSCLGGCALADRRRHCVLLALSVRYAEAPYDPAKVSFRAVCMQLKRKADSSAEDAEDAERSSSNESPR